MAWEFTSRQVYSLALAAIAGFASVAVTTVVMRWQDVDRSENLQWTIIRDMERTVNLLEFVVLEDRCHADEEPSTARPDARSGER